MPSFLRLFLLSIILFAVSACSGESRTEELGPFSGTGSIFNADVSLVRRGSHLFRTEEGQEYFLESKTVNISEFTGKKVWLEGVREKNTKGTTPVIVLQTVRLVDADDVEWSLPQMGIHITLPRHWQKEEQRQEVRFTRSGSTMLRLSTISGALKEGKEIFIGTEKATLQSDAETVSVSLSQGKKTINISLNKEAFCQYEDCTIIHPEEWLEELLQKNVQREMEDVVPKSASSQQGGSMPCGGEAGILCPSGSFCDIHDVAHQIGTCKAKK